MILRPIRRRYCRMCKEEINSASGRQFCELCSILRQVALATVHQKVAKKRFFAMSEEEQEERKRMVRKKVEEEVRLRQEEEDEGP